MTRPTAPNLLADSGLPLAYAVHHSAATPTPPGSGSYELGIRTAVRSLTVMQKEAVVASNGSGTVWRLSSDEGPYLAGHDEAPAPLAVTTAGLTADVMHQVSRALAARSLASSGMVVQFDTYFTMSGSMQRGTMIGGAQAPDIAVSLTDVPHDVAHDAVLTGIRMAATTTLFSRRLRSLFALVSNGRPIPVGRVGSIENGSAPTHVAMASPEPAAAVASEPIVSKLYSVEDKPSDAGIALRDSQDRALHIRATGQWRSDGMKEIDVNVIRPTGSMFRFLSDEPDGRGGEGRAPDALTLVSAGLGFCFMTQIGRFAKLVSEDLGRYRIDQDTWFTVGDPTTDPVILGDAAAPQTHVFLEPASHDDEFARHALDMSEQTCFLHAMCRTELRPKVRVLDAR